MRAPDETARLLDGLRDRVLERLGFAGPPVPTLGDLCRVYRAWCAAVPFDNVRKMVALRSGRPLPGRRAEEFFERWLADGAGATCWPTSNALFALVRALGFEARRVAGSMRDTGVVTHASVKVRIDGRDWLVDSSMLTNVLLPLTGEPFIHRDPVWPVEVEPAGATHVVWTHTPPNPSRVPCRLLVDPADPAAYHAGYEASRQRSPFNHRLYARRNHPGELRLLIGATRYSKTAAGVESRELGPDELRRALGEDIGLSATLVEEWVRCGGLEASLAPPAGGPASEP